MGSERGRDRGHLREKEGVAVSRKGILRWYDMPCPVCGAEQVNSWDKRVSRALGYKQIVCEACIAKEYDTTAEELRHTMESQFGLVPCPGL